MNARARGRKSRRLDVLGGRVVGAHAATSCALDRGRRCAGGARRACRRARGSTVRRRRKRCRSCSKVTPMPPWSCTQSCSELGAVVADVGLRRADQLGGLGGARRRPRRPPASLMRVAGLEPHLHVGEAVLERLVGGERPAERVAVERPLDGHVEARSAWRRPTRRCAMHERRAGAGARPGRRRRRPRRRPRRPGRARRRSVTAAKRRVRSTRRERA